MESAGVALIIALGGAILAMFALLLVIDREALRRASWTFLFPPASLVASGLTRQVFGEDPPALVGGLLVAVLLLSLLIVALGLAAETMSALADRRGYRGNGEPGGRDDTGERHAQRRDSTAPQTGGQGGEPWESSTAGRTPRSDSSPRVRR